MVHTPGLLLAMLTPAASIFTVAVSLIVVVSHATATNACIPLFVYVPPPAAAAAAARGRSRRA